MGPIPQDLTTVWPKLMPGAILWLDGGLFFASACANNVGLEITIVSLVVFWIVNFVSMLALLVVRRRHGLIIHGLKSGFFVSQEQPVDELVAPTAKANVDLTRDVADLSAQPRHESMIVPSLTKKWDPSCTMINEAAPHFSRAEHIIEMFDFFHNPLEARVFAAVFGVSRICASALDMTVLYSASMLIAPGLNPVYLMCAAVLMSFALRALPRSSLSSLECTLTGALIVGTFAAFLLHGAAVGFAWDPLHHRRISRHQAPHEWYYAVIAATCLTFERHSSVAEYFVAEHRPRSPTDPPVDSLSKNPNFTGPNAKRTLNGLTALMGFKFVVTLLFVVLGYLVVPHYHGHKGTPFSLARKLDVSTIGAQIAWWAAVLCPPWINVVGHVGAPRQAVAAFRYALTGARYDWEPSRISIAWAVPVLAFAMSLSLSSDGLAWWVVPGYRIGSVFFSAVAPFVVLRCSRMCARRLGIPRRLDDALRVPPFIRRLCTTVGVACVLVITAGALGWFNTA